MPKSRKKSKFRHVIIKNKKYYFYKITWADITGDAGHATKDEFISYEQGDELFSDRNVYPIGCIMKMEKINL
jgi:hypothetical protein